MNGCATDPVDMELEEGELLDDLEVNHGDHNNLVINGWTSTKKPICESGLVFHRYFAR